MDDDDIMLVDDITGEFLDVEMLANGMGEDDDTMDAEESGESTENQEESPEPGSIQAEPTRRSNRQPKKKKRSSSDSGEDADDSTVIHASHPLSNTDRLIQVGPEFQAVIPELGEALSANDSVLSVDEDKDEQIWSNESDYNQLEMNFYIEEAQGRFRLPIDRALFILRKENYDFERAIEEVGRRRQLFDLWTDEETKLFESAFLVHGKNFGKIRSAMPSRSMASIVQHYYNTKKMSNYVSSYEARFKDDLTDEESNAESDNEDFLEGTCENCGEKTERLKVNTAMNRSECPACITYLRLMRVPRPANMRLAADQLKRLNASCPQSMRKHVWKYDELTAPGTGDPMSRLKIGSERREDDDECMILNECTLERPSSPYVVNTTRDEDPVDPNTCRMTRDFDNDEAKDLIKNMQGSRKLAIPLIWRRNTTICMEDIKILNEEARRTVYDANIIYNRVKLNDLNNWRQDMSMLKLKMDRKSSDSDLAPSAQSSRSGRLRHDLNWTEEERESALRCFHWYGDDFDTVSDVMGTKSSDQVKAFYSDLGESLIASIEEYRRERRLQLDDNEIAPFYVENKDNLRRFNPIDYVSLD